MELPAASVKKEEKRNEKGVDRKKIEEPTVRGTTVGVLSSPRHDTRSAGSPTHILNNPGAGISPAGDPKRAGLKVMLRRQIEKVNTRRRGPRSPQSGRVNQASNESEDEDHHEAQANNSHQGTKYERLERAVKRQLSKGRHARRKLVELRGKIETRKKFEKRHCRGEGYDETTGYTSECGPNSPLAGGPSRSKRLVLPAEVGGVKRGGLFRRRLRSKVKSEALLLVPDDDDDDEEEDLLNSEDEELLADDDLDEEELVWRHQAVEEQLQAASKLNLSVLFGLMASASSFTVASIIYLGQKTTLQENNLLFKIQTMLSFLVLVLNADTARRSVLHMSTTVLRAATGRQVDPIQRLDKKADTRLRHTARTNTRSRLHTGAAAANENSLGGGPRERKHQTARRNSRSLSPRMRWPHWQVPQVSRSALVSNSWATVPASNFSLRGPNYVTGDRVKVPSEPALYEPIQIHIFETNGMVNVLEAYPEILAQAKAVAPPCLDDVFPRVLCLTLNVPKEAPSMRGFWPGSPCFTIVCLFATSEHVRKQAESSKLTNGYRLFRNWISCADRDLTFNSRLKGAFFCRPANASADEDGDDMKQNEVIVESDDETSPVPGTSPLTSSKHLSEPGSPNKHIDDEHQACGGTEPPNKTTRPLSPERATTDTLSVVNTTAEQAEQDKQHSRGGLPRIIQKWNGKPVLMAENATGFSRTRKGISKLTRGDGYVEVSINVGDSFSYMGRGAVYVMLGKLPNLAVDCCFAIEGRAPDELPEAVLGCLTFTSLKLYDIFNKSSASGIVLGGTAPHGASNGAPNNPISNADVPADPPPLPPALQPPHSPPPSLRKNDV